MKRFRQQLFVPSVIDDTIAYRYNGKFLRTNMRWAFNLLPKNAMIASYDCQKPKNATANWSSILPDYTESFKTESQVGKIF